LGLCFDIRKYSYLSILVSKEEKTGTASGCQPEGSRKDHDYLLRSAALYSCLTSLLHFAWEMKLIWLVQQRRSNNKTIPSKARTQK